MIRAQFCFNVEHIVPRFMFLKTEMTSDYCQLQPQWVGPVMVWYQLPFDSKNSAVTLQLLTLPSAL